MVLLFFIIMGIDLVEAWAFGHLARQLNLKVRQSLGRMFGFTLDAFGQISTVAALNLEPRLVSDYRLFARDYFTCAPFSILPAKLPRVGALPLDGGGGGEVPVDPHCMVFWPLSILPFTLPPRGCCDCYGILAINPCSFPSPASNPG